MDSNLWVERARFGFELVSDRLLWTDTTPLANAPPLDPPHCTPSWYESAVACNGGSYSLWGWAKIIPLPLYQHPDNKSNVVMQERQQICNTPSANDVIIVTRFPDTVIGVQLCDHLGWTCKGSLDFNWTRANEWWWRREGKRY